MAILNIRNLPDEVHAQLRIRAAKAGRSMEAEARAILTEAVLQPQPSLSAADLQAWVDELYGQNRPVNVVEQFIQDRHREAALE